MTEPAPIARVTPATDVVRLVQLTDIHLCQQAGGTLLGMDTDASLQQVLAQVQRERAQYDLVLATGDLSDKGALHAYERLESYLETLAAHHYWLPGNHDDRDQMLAAARDPERLTGKSELGRGRFSCSIRRFPARLAGAWDLRSWRASRRLSSRLKPRVCTVCCACTINRWP
ncbi:metallophosphoesterase [Halioglobus japonicus]|uniref:metallophosphoesterase n=1 Tax=Halioglobus japonicus TaxID=930805 RepID=UPI001F0A6249|nr:metallophosphoesterase [Halioglobus japonicus]